ncbi:MAG: hypothetical protein EBZ26_07140, partial [Flavobacteriia bacterium]|nr:hypothetical protein [Flavobacteriia bacterium]
MKRSWILAIALVALPALSWAQVLTQTVRGTIVDADSKFPLMGATVSIGDQKVVTDDQGSFKLVNIPVGRQTLT